MSKKVTKNVTKNVTKKVTKPKPEIEKGYEVVYEWCKRDPKLKPVTTIKEIKEFEVKVKDAHPEMTKVEVRDTAIGRFFAAKKKRLTDVGGEDIILFTFRNTGPFDWVAKKKAVARMKYDEDPDAAVSDGYVRLVYNEMAEVVDVIELYYWAKNRQGLPNKKLGDDLPETGFLWTPGGIGMLKSEFDACKTLQEIGKKIRKVEISISNEFANERSENFKELTMHQWLLANMKIRLDDKKTRTLYLEARNATMFNKPFEGIDVDNESILKLFKDQKIGLDNLTQTFNDNIEWKDAHSKGTNKTFMSEVFVSAVDPGTDDISPSIAVTSSEMGMIDDEGNEVRPVKVWWNKVLPLDFGEGSKISLFYRMKQNEIRAGNVYSGDWGPITFTAEGCIVLVREEVEIELQEEEPEKVAVGSRKISSKIEDDEGDLDFEDLELGEDEEKEIEIDEEEEEVEEKEIEIDEEEEEVEEKEDKIEEKDIEDLELEDFDDDEFFDDELLDDL